MLGCNDFCWCFLSKVWVNRDVIRCGDPWRDELEGKKESVDAHLFYFSVSHVCSNRFFSIWTKSRATFYFCCWTTDFLFLFDTLLHVFTNVSSLMILLTFTDVFLQKKKKDLSPSLWEIAELLARPHYSFKAFLSLRCSLPCICCRLWDWANRAAMSLFYCCCELKELSASSTSLSHSLSHLRSAFRATSERILFFCWRSLLRCSLFRGVFSFLSNGAFFSRRVLSWNNDHNCH